jgi:Fe-Mn family superoxide dismutase
MCEEVCPRGTRPRACGSYLQRFELQEGFRMNIESPAIPYNFADLEPVMSRDTLVFHFLRHQRVCFDRLRLLIRETELAELPLDELIRVTARDPAQHNIHRWAAEVWNHDLYWRSMRARGGGSPQGPVAEHIRRCFGTFEGFAREFKEAANAHFGSGWLWLVWRHDALHIVTTSNAGTPLVRGDVALLALDLWEHAYYLDFQNRRAAYVSAFLEDLVDWNCANRVLASLGAPAAAPRPAALPLQPGVGERLAS